MELSNEFVEDLFFRQMKEVTIRSNKQLKSFDAQFSGWLKLRGENMKQKFLDEYVEKLDFYDETYLEDELENDEINSIEEGFMLGYLG